MTRSRLRGGSGRCINGECMERVRIGVIGCGAISGQYLTMAKNFPSIEIAGCSDIDLDRARARAKEFGITRACGVDELLSDGSIEIILNLTIPGAHVPVTIRAIEAGKHAYVEKPLALDRVEARRVLDAATARKLRIGGAPDTFM